MIQERLLSGLRFKEDDHGWALDVGFKIGKAYCINVSQDEPSQVPHRLATLDIKRDSTEINQRLAEREIEIQIPSGLCDTQSWDDILDRTLNLIQKDASPAHRAFVMIGFVCSCLKQAKLAETEAPQYGTKVLRKAKIIIGHLRRFCPPELADRFDAGALIAVLLPLAISASPEQALRNAIYEWQRPMTVLLVQSDPTDKGRLRLNEHQQRISETLTSSHYRSDFEIQVIANARPELLGPKIAELRPTVIHFSGHSSTSGVVMSDPVGKAVQISPGRLASLLALAKRDRLRGIVMNACYTADQLSANAAAGLGQVVVMEGLLEDNASIRFSQQFYAYLGTGMSFKQSFEWASVSADLAELEGRLAPKLFNI